MSNQTENLQDFIFTRSYYVSGGAFNPAVSFGAAIVSGYWPNHYVYWAGPVVGALISAALYRSVSYHCQSQ